MNRTSRILAFCCVALFALFVTACGGGGQPNNTSSTTSSTPTAESANSSASGSPAEAAKSYIDTALTTTNDITGMLCSTIADDVKIQMQAGLAASKAVYAQSGATLDTSGLTYTANNQTADTATVDIAGKLKITTNGTTTEVDSPVTQIVMKNESGVWKACG